MSVTHERFLRDRERRERERRELTSDYAACADQLQAWLEESRADAQAWRRFARGIALLRDEAERWR